MEDRLVKKRRENDNSTPVVQEDPAQVIVVKLESAPSSFILKHCDGFGNGKHRAEYHARVPNTHNSTVYKNTPGKARDVSKWKTHENTQGKARNVSKWENV